MPGPDAAPGRRRHDAGTDDPTTRGQPDQTAGNGRAGPVRGLSSAQAARRLARDGPNAVPIAPPTPAWRELAGQMIHFFALMLWVAAALALAAGLPELTIAIVAVIVLNGVFAFVQEHRAERAAHRLRELVPRRAIAVRDGRRVDLEVRELVVGDLVVLTAGDRVPADGLLVEAHDVTVDRSTLTGESVPEAASAAEALFAGTFVVAGEGRAELTATGPRTRLAGIAALTEAARRPPSPLTRELHRVVRAIAMVAVGVGTLSLAATIALGTPLVDGATLAIGVTVALVPEALLPTVTLSLALGAQAMSRQRGLVRRLESVETLGSTTFICTDKTGTLTVGQMAVVRAWTAAGGARVEGEGYAPTGRVELERPGTEAALRALARAAGRCSSGRVVRRDGAWVPLGDPMEAALDAFAHRLGLDLDSERAARPDGRRYPFDPHRRRMSLVVDDRLLVKGAPDAVLPRCTDPSAAATPLATMTRAGLRVIAVAERMLAGALPEEAEAAERALTLLGLIGLEDPPRPESAPAIAACRRAGIHVAMVTGDHPATAVAIAEEVGLRLPAAPVLTGADLPTDDAALAAVIDHDGTVVSRVAPEDKLRIARALRARGHVVAMTGDGVNDGPALREADIGVAMGRGGTDVAREAADLVLLDDNFATIVAAVEQGRATYANVRRFLTYHLTDNVAELTPFLVWALSGGSIPLALGVLQILALDIGTDTLSAAALGAEPPSPGTLRGPPAQGRLFSLGVARRAFGVLGPAEAVVEMAAFFAAFAAVGWLPGEPFPTGDALLGASGAAFAAVVVGQSANAFACRSATLTPRALGWTGNRLLVIAVAIEAAIAAMALGVPPLADALGQAAPPVEGLALALAAGPAVLVADALHKARMRRRGAPPREVLRRPRRRARRSRQ